jgi:superoxide dismutase, Cu-Zn family
MRLRSFLILTLLAGMGAAAEQKTARATFAGKDGKSAGTATLTETNQGVLIRVELSGLPPGTHAIHVHEKGLCEAPGFDSAGGHFNPHAKEHGYTDKGPHAGDLPNIHVPASGQLTFELLARDVTLTSGPGFLLDLDGSALVIHEKADDYKTGPAGNAGARIACAVIKEK